MALIYPVIAKFDEPYPRCIYNIFKKKILF